MATKVTLDVKRLNEIIEKMPERAEEIVQQGALAVQGEAAGRAPVDTGALRNSILATKQGKLVWWVQDGVEYGIYQELGFRHLGGAFVQHPFMVPGVEAMREAYNQMWAELFK